MDNTFVTVATYPNSIEAHVARSFLEVNGILAVFASEYTGIWSLSNLNETKLQVSAANVDRAKELLATTSPKAPDAN